MDVLSFMIDTLRAELGDDIFTDEKRWKFELAMRQQIGSDRHYIASAAACERAIRNRAIVAHFAAGGSVQAAVERFGLTDRQLRTLRQQAAEEGALRESEAA